MKGQLTEINITKEDGEVLVSINFDTMDVFNRKDVVVRMNYGEPKAFEEIDGKIYIGKDQVD